ncbi:MAG TPA: M28 family peptidase [Thermoanaerobaculia bacterium]|nr:M28 family peptidase [Thermoanaerobaculia bacterium]
MTAKTAHRLALGAAVLAAALLTPAAAAGPTAAAAQLPAGVSPAAGAAAAEAITAETLEAPIRFLADDLLEGRGPAGRGDRLTQSYLASTMQLLGLEPGGPDGSWYQPFPIVGIEATMPATWSFRRGDDELVLQRSEQFIAASGVQAPRAAIDDAELVFVGYGIQAPEYGWDDYEGADLDGKVLVMLNNDPDWDEELFAGERRLYYGRWTYKYESAARQGAAGAIIVHTTPSAGYPWQVVQTSWTGEQFQLPAGDEPRLQVAAWTTEDATRELLALAGRDWDELVAAAKRRDFRPVPLGVTTSIALDNEISRVETANVAGLLRGSDPELADQVVVFTAHHDHLGIAPPGDDPDADRIYNGALDNATGVAQVLAIARAFTELPEPPRRSLLFLFVGAEEQGLLGSQYYAANPTVPAGKIAANLNFDGGNIWGETEDLTLIGMGKSDLDAIAETVAASQGRRLMGDQFPDRGYYYRSDQFSFAKIGVPALYFDGGTDFVGRPEGWGKQQVDAWTEEHYHQPSDELEDDWDYSGMVQDARLGFYAGLLIANRPELPAWVPGDEFEAARRQALAEVGAD